MTQCDSKFSRVLNVKTACVVALHCSLGSGRQWKRLAAELGAGIADRAGSSRLWRQCVRVRSAADARRRSRILRGTFRRRGGTDPSGRPFLWRRHRVQDRDRSAVRASHPQPDADRAGAADAAVRERCGPAAARPVRRSRARGFGGSLERIGAGSDRQILRVLERLRPAGAAAAGARLRMIEHADKLAFDFAAAFAEENVDERGGLATRADAAVFGRAVAQSHPAHRAAAGRDHGRRGNAASAGRRPYAADDPCGRHQSRDRGAYRPRG